MAVHVKSNKNHELKTFLKEIPPNSNCTIWGADKKSWIEILTTSKIAEETETWYKFGVKIFASGGTYPFPAGEVMLHFHSPYLKAKHGLVVKEGEVEIQNGQVKGEMLAERAVENINIALGAVNGKNTEGTIEKESIESEQYAATSIPTAAYQNKSVTKEKLAEEVLITVAAATKPVIGEVGGTGTELAKKGTAGISTTVPFRIKGNAAQKKFKCKYGSIFKSALIHNVTYWKGESNKPKEKLTPTMAKEPTVSVAEEEVEFEFNTAPANLEDIHVFVTF
jgi:hypothetical protein